MPSGSMNVVVAADWLEDQVVPPFTLNCQVAPGSMPVTVTEPFSVIPSVPLTPVSLVSAKEAAAGAVVSTVMAAAFDATPLWLPARSAWRTRIAPMA